MELVRAALCEDEEYVRDLLARSLRMEFVSYGIGLEVDCFATGDELLAAVQQGARYRIYFLDIEMPGTNGIDICRQLRAGLPATESTAAVPAAPDAIVVFVSNKEELVFQSLEVQPFRFMRKSHYVQEQSSVVRAIVAELERQRGHIITVTDSSTKQTYRVDADQTLYVEVLGKRCQIHTTTGMLDIKCRLSDVEELLAGHGFLKPHRSYLVNSQHVFSMGKTSLTLIDKTEIPISRNRVAEVREEFLELMQEGR